MSLKETRFEKRLKSLKSQTKISLIYDDIGRSFERQRLKILAYNRANLLRGKDVAGDDIEPPYTRRTRILKRRKAQPFDRVTLRDTGRFHRSMNFKVSKKSVLFFSKDKVYRKYLEKKYRKDNALLGINKDQIKLVLKIAINDTRIRLKQGIGA